MNELMFKEVKSFNCLVGQSMWYTLSPLLKWDACDFTSRKVKKANVVSLRLDFEKNA